MEEASTSRVCERAFGLKPCAAQARLKQRPPQEKSAGTRALPPRPHQPGRGSEEAGHFSRPTSATGSVPLIFPFPLTCLTLHGPSVLPLLAPRIASRVGIQTSNHSPVLPTVFPLHSSEIQKFQGPSSPRIPLPPLCPLALHSLTNALQAAASVH